MCKLLCFVFFFGCLSLIGAGRVKRQGFFGFPQNNPQGNINQFLGGLINETVSNFDQFSGGSLSSIFGQQNGCEVNNGGCEQLCRIKRRRKQCYCHAGYTVNVADGTCSDIDECAEFKPCQEICTNTKGSYRCGCSGRGVIQPDGSCKNDAFFIGGGVSSFRESCSTNNGRCEQICNQLGSTVECSCKPGYAVSFQNVKSCVDLDECASGTHNCQGECMNTVGSFKCLGSGRPSAPNISPQPVFPIDNGPRSCEVNNGGCQQNCKVNRRGVLKCKCFKNFVLQPDGRSCVCPPGFAVKGKQCLETSANQGSGPINCDVNNGGCEQLCRVNRRGVHRCRCRKNFVPLTEDRSSCSCPPPFRLSPNGRKCEERSSNQQIDGCLQNNGGCQHRCSPNRDGSVICSCNANFKLDQNGLSCSLVDPCAVNNGGCDHICTNRQGSPFCTCRPGFQLSSGRCIQITTIPPPQPPPTTGSNTGSKPKSGCGENDKKDLLRRIVGGKPADPKDWPWMAAILQKRNKDQFCGGVLITDRHVLSAAHCLVDFQKGDITVRLGEYDFTDTTDNNPTDFDVIDIRIHESYNRTSQENDIAIMRLDRPSTFSDYIWPVCLPPQDTTFLNKLGYVTGWGTTSFGGKVSRLLQEVVVPVWSQGDCSSAYPNKIASTMMCAGLREGGKDSCQGDSGGPFLVQIYPEARWFVAGVVSWGIKCAEAGNPGVYTRVNMYLPWIKANSLFN